MARLNKQENQESLLTVVAALRTVANMRHPSIADLLRAKGYWYEATKIEDLVNTFLVWEHKNGTRV